MTEMLSIHWNVDPVLIRLGALSVRWYGLMFVAGFILGWYLFRWFFRREGVREELLDPLLLTLFLSTIIGARLGHCIFYQPTYYFAPFVAMFGGTPDPAIARYGMSNWGAFLEILMVWKGGLASHGGAIAILLGMWWFASKYGKPNNFDYLWIMDRLVITVAFAGCFIRLGNLFNSEIYGDATTLPWGIIFDRNHETVPKHPTQLYESLSYLILGLYLVLNYRNRLHKMWRGFLFGAFFIGCFGMRFIIEFIKEPQVEFENAMALDMGQLLSIPFVIAGICLVAWAYKKKIPAAICKPEPPKKSETHFAHPV